ncbi:hypothetical protein M9H77_02149 [Catharanthus roseus]|uniref:Uncharacterized protein n=1 Tax=Catharanthus roseus TaxID=4058 RepID=A0ACC0C7W1_CATRO|nr:hypothetical protein M9H77_02149 [Catharanthus roseus]
MIAEGSLGSSPRNTEQILREYSEAVVSQSVEEQVDKFSIVVDGEETTTQASKESTFLEEEEAEQEILERRHYGLPIIEEPPQVTSKTRESKRNECVPENMGEFEESEIEKETKVPWMQSKEKDEERRNLMEFKGDFESIKRK